MPSSGVDNINVEDSVPWWRRTAPERMVDEWNGHSNESPCIEMEKKKEKGERVNVTLTSGP